MAEPKSGMLSEYDQSLLDAVDMCQEKLDAQQHQHRRFGRVGEKRGRSSQMHCDRDGIPEDKSLIDVAALEKWMPVCEHLAVGQRFMNKRDLEHYISSRHVKVIFNLRDSDGPKTLWYAEKAMTLGVQQVIHKPLETCKDKDRTRVSDGEVLAMANQVADAMRTLHALHNDHPRGTLATVFVHGYDGANIATVVALVAWYLYRDDNHFNPQQGLVERYDAEIASNFPEHWFHREQVARICGAERQSIYAAMKRGKMSVTRGVQHSTRFPKESTGTSNVNPTLRPITAMFSPRAIGDAGV